MSGVSPYLNPQWPEADWDVSGAFTHDRELLSFFDYCRLLLGFEPFHMVHGSPLCLWNSGRVLQHLLRSAEEIRTAGLAYEARKIAVFLTFTNLALKEEHLNDPLGNAICTFFTRHNPTKRNSVILASDLLRDHIREKFPELRLISSILKITNGGGKGNLDAYKKLADEYDDVMVHPDDVLNYDLLEKLEDKDRYILLINEYCIRNCPLRPFHYKSLSEMSLNFTGYDSSEFEKRQSKNGCQNLFTLLAHETRTCSPSTRRKSPGCMIWASAISSCRGAASPTPRPSCSTYCALPCETMRRTRTPCTATASFSGNPSSPTPSHERKRNGT